MLIVAAYVGRTFGGVAFAHRPSPRGRINPPVERLELSAQFAAIAQQAQNAGMVDEVSVSFRRLDALEFAGVNARTTYPAASLYKIPLAMAFLHQGELDPQLLSAPVEVAPKGCIDDSMWLSPVEGRLTASGLERPERLLQAMLRDSSNVAYMSLLDALPVGAVGGYLKSVGVPFDTGGDVVRASPDMVTHLLSGLYAASQRELPFLSRDHANLVLDELAHSSFRIGITQGVPQGVPVMNKYGERGLRHEDGTPASLQLSECAIVKPADGPYALCVVTRGDDYAHLAEVITALSRAAYDGRHARPAPLEPPRLASLLH